MPTRTRIVALAPLIILTLLTGLAAVAGLAMAGPENGPESESEATAVPFDLKPGLERLAGTTGRYDNLITFGPITMRDIGRFDLTTGTFAFTRIIRSPDGRDEFNVRRLGDGTTYLQVTKADNAPSCWGKHSSDEPSEMVMERVGLAASQAPAPTPVLALLQTKYEGATRTALTVTAEIDAYFGLALLGVNTARVLLPLADELDGILIPLRIKLDGESPDANVVGAEVRGDEALAALTGVELGSEVTQAIAQVDNKFTLRSTGEKVAIEAPPSADIIPAGQDAWDSCTAK